ncbi:hypothetical protein COCON_G00204160 [Conger conger]|uniref:Protein FAM117A n=1 Tax=Conger conger TaxID=82655 RepID=A0A9Q1CZ87_CONCO|nr:protein FAM117A-like [Conger conger]KAJ8253804.1 hypothetical protein COCON_G00204160 [Conger conger]
MSCRSGVGRGGTSGVQPLKATVPFQLHNKAQPRLRDAKTAEKTKSRPPKPSIRRTLSLDNMVGPYLQGQWPKEPHQASCVNDKATQTPSTWLDESRGRRAGVGHKRSASWGSAEHLKDIAKLKHHLQKRSKHGLPGGQEQEPQLQQHPLPAGHALGATQTMPLTPLCRVTSRLRHSVEGLNLELERVFVHESPVERQQILDVPDGHRAPVPSARRCSSDLSPALLSPPPSPSSAGEAADPADCAALGSSPSPPPGSAGPSPCSPRPRKTCSFQREPPEGCERVRVCEEALSPCEGQSAPRPSCPDPNKVNFTPHGGSAFCPVSLLKPLLPSMDILFRSLSVSPVTARPGQGGAPTVGGYLGPLPDSATTAM